MSQQDLEQQGPLFAGFNPATAEQWRDAAQKSLKGAPLGRLSTRTIEGFDLEPIYHSADVEGLPHLGGLPGQSPYVRGTTCLGHRIRPWTVQVDPRAADPKTWNALAREELEGGADGLGLGELPVATVQEVADALRGVDLSSTAITLGMNATMGPSALYFAAVRELGADLEGLSGSLGMDPLGTLARRGSLPAPLESLYGQMADLIGWCMERSPDLAVALVHGHLFHDAGASAAQEVAYALAAGTEYLRELRSRGMTPDRAAPRIGYTLAVGTRCFTEIAKLRAARLLWDRIAEAFGCDPKSRRMRIHARTSSWTGTRWDPHVNMLRATVEAFAAIIGGVESLAVQAFDAPLGAPGRLGRRLARNTQIVLREEAHLDKVVDPAGGSWSVEALTDQIARASWELFQQVERRGGMGAALSSGLVREQIDAVVQRRREAVARRREPFVGVSVSALPHEEMLGSAQVEEAGTAGPPGAPHAGKIEGFTSAVEAAAAGAALAEISRALCGAAPHVTIEAIPARRGAEAFERLRDAAAAFREQNGELPGVLMASLGPVADHRARAEWTAGFLAAGGLEVKASPDGFSSPQEAANAATGSGARVVVLCGADAVYPEQVPEVVRLLREARSKLTLVVAGRPPGGSDGEADWADGVDLFVNVKTEMVEALTEILQRCGVEVGR